MYSNILLAATDKTLKDIILKGLSKGLEQFVAQTTKKELTKHYDKKEKYFNSIKSLKNVEIKIIL